MMPFRSELVLANFNEVFVPFHGPSIRPVTLTQALGLWQKAVIASGQEGYMLVAPGMPSNLGPPTGAWFVPRQVVVPSSNSDQLCRDLLKDGEAWAGLVRELSDQGPVQIWSQVFSPGVEALVEALVASGVKVDVGELPLVPSSVVRYWNTKVGGRDLLRGIPEVREVLPASVVCNTLVELMTLLATEDSERGFVVKANCFAGGVGIWLFPPGCSRSLDDIRKRLATPRFKGKKAQTAKSLGEVTGPYLVEEMVGVLGANVSPTADFWIRGDGVVEVLGIGEQLLEDGVAYQGCCYPVRGDQSQLELCMALGQRICAQLYRSGYRGPVNIDFVLAEDGVRVAEMNLRQSAPLDQFLVMHRLYGDQWCQEKAFFCEEAVPLSLRLETTEQLSRLLLTGLHLSKGELVLPTAIYGTEAGSCTASLLSIADSLPAAHRLASLTRSLVGGLANGSPSV